MTQTSSPIQNLLVIDSQVMDWHSLTAGVNADTTLLILDSGAEGLTQISDYLSNAYKQGLPLLQSIQIVSHGSMGSMQLGSSTITKSNLTSYSKQLAKIGSSLTDTGDILLYGCNVAAGQIGLDFINQFSMLTNADVAASNDITGSTAIGGNWQLEVSTSPIESNLALNTATLNNFLSTLNINTPNVLSTQLVGGLGYDDIWAVSSIADGSLYVTGSTDGNLNGQANHGFNDGFVIKLNNDGATAWTQLIGANGSEGIKSVTVGIDNSLYLAVVSDSGFYNQNNQGSTDSYVIKLDAVGDIKRIDQIGGIGSDVINSIATGRDGSIYAAGSSDSNLNGEINHGINDGFIVKINADGSSGWTHLIGGSGSDNINCITSSLDGSLYVAGWTDSDLNNQKNQGGLFGDGFIVKLNANGTTAWTQLIGGSGSDIISSISTNSSGMVYVTGSTESNLNGKTNQGGKYGDGFVIELNPDNGSVIWTSLIGGAGSDVINSIITGLDGSLYVAGSTDGALNGQTSHGLNDGFIAKLNTDGVTEWTHLIGGIENDAAYSLSTDTKGQIYVVGNTDNNLNGQIGKGSGDGFIVKLIPGQYTPTLTDFSSVVGSGNKGSVIPITLENLLTQGNEIDVDGTVTAFVIKSLTSGSLKIGTSSINATPWDVTTNNIIDATHQAYWLPTGNSVGILNAFTVVAKDNDNLESITPIQTKISITSLNNPPTLTDFSSVVGGGNKDSVIPITLENLLTQGNEIDVDGTVTAFVIKSLTSGSLKIGTSSINATPWDVTSNNIIDATRQAYWLPTANSIGILNAFNVVAKDNNNLESILPIQAKISITSPNNPAIGTVTITGIIAQNQTLTAESNLTDLDGIGTDIDYQWLANGKAISGAIGTTLILGQDQIGKVISVLASYTDKAGNLESVGSSVSSKVMNITVPGTNGADKLKGSNVDDLYIVNNSKDIITEKPSSGIDTVISSISYTLAANLENLILSGSKAINATGNKLNNTLIGNAANNKLNGGAGEDILNGGLGNDILTGGAGADILNGGLSNDILTGGSGKDIFQLTSLTKDTIKDFSIKDDTIQIEHNVFNKLGELGILKASYFKIGTSATDADDFLIYNSNSGALTYDANANSAGGITQIALLGLHLALTNADFVII